MCWFVQQFWNNQKKLDMSRRKQANPAKLDPQEEDDLEAQHLRLAEDETAASSASGGSGCGETQPFDDEQVQGDQDQDTKPGPYKCTVCGENYLKEKLLREHEQSHTDHLQFTCAYCPRLFKHKRSRDRHTKLHTGDKKYKCQQCDSAFSRSDHLKIHMKTHDSRKPYKCGTCNRGYNTAAALSSHQQSHLKQESRSGSRTSGGSTPSPGLFRCTHCAETFGKPDLLQSHVAMVHSDTDSSLSQTPEPLSEYQNQIEDLKIVCMYCSKEFPSLELMYQHTNIAHRDVPNGVTTSVSVSSPAIQNSPKPEICQNGTPTYACDRCTMQLDSLQNLKNHINNVHWRPALSPNPVNFMGIEKSYSPFQTQPTDLSRKKKSEDSAEKAVKKKKDQHSPTAISPYDSNDKPCICSCCYAQLPNFKSFLHHMESHVISSNNSLLGFCPVCGEPGRDPVSFTNHIFSHAIAQVPGRCCYTCKKSFERLEELQKHLLEVHVVSVFKCSICNDIFDTKISMQLHLTNKHSDECKHFKCYLCTNQVFHDRLSAELHISMKHYQQFTPCVGANQLLRSQYQELDTRFRDYNMIFQCTFCHKTFKDQYSQYIHILKEHNESKEGEKFILDSAMNPNPSRSPNFMFPKIVTPDHVEPLESVYTCDICNRSDITSESDLINHKKLHHSSKNKIGPVSLQCAYCNEYCKSRTDLENHMKTHQVTCGKGKHKCNICDEIYSSTLTLADHKLTHCKIVEGNSCVQCKSVLTDENSFYSHQLQHSNPGKPNSQISLPANCIICCQTLQTDVEIKLHAKFHLKHLTQKEYMCGVCSKVFDSQGQPANDVNIVVCKDCAKSEDEGKKVPKQFACIQCPQTFDSESDVQNHAAMHMLNEGTNLECRLCKQVFSSPLKLQTHLIEHNFYGMNQYSCYVCSSVFTAASGLQSHIIGHGLDSRPYECSQCQMKFFFRAELDNHRFVHLQKSYPIHNGGEIYENKPSPRYKICKYCSNSYLDNSFFVEHLNQCPFRISPKRETFDNEVDNNIKQEVTEIASEEKDEQ
ncbi:zinc finger protein 423 homolog isoform X1 [Tribolium castaneum]|uniref:Zinc finger protein 423-like Protein n=1 Tax=Tribolium castaneum TaxID=7070 RepID=D6W676_TRICA|nr:PREDICTED: zinc finger protein 423 homolog isoform X1 [Tribolium castaneum]EFA11085.2 Zinc finger protein 423-like Protein [Tribolium castaneum]|eukprot:XP_015833075.1 PREDICTED: zinc finger protein 423 homolog isoform X1 [Tribolium castaneum]